MSIARKIVWPVMHWKALLVFTVLGGGAVGLENLLGVSERGMAVVAENVACSATSINSDGKVDIQCGDVQDSFTNSKIAISLLQAPQPLSCTLRETRGRADCALPDEEEA